MDVSHQKQAVLKTGASPNHAAQRAAASRTYAVVLPDASRSSSRSAPIFRYLVIHARGGVYADADSVCVRPLDAWLDADEDRLVVALNGPPRFDVSQWAFAAPPGHRVLAAAAALAVDNLLRSSGNLPRKRGAKRAGAFPANFTARPPNVVPGRPTRSCRRKKQPPHFYFPRVLVV